MNYLQKNLEEYFSIPKREWREVDKLIYGLDDYFLYDAKKVREQRFKAIKEAFAHHFQNNLFYHKYCKENNVSPHDIKEEDDLKNIPLIPDKFFKDYPDEDPRILYEWLYRITSIDIGEFDFKEKTLQDFLVWAENKLNGVVTHSSGTTGKFSFIFRDDITRRRMFYSADKTLLFSIYPPSENAHLIYPGPIKTHLTMGRWIAEGAKIFKPEYRHFLTDKALTIDIVRLLAGQIRGMGDKLKLMIISKAMHKGQIKLLNMLKEMDKNGEQIYIITFPFQLYDLMKMMEEEGVYLNFGESNSVIITGGGWKIHEHRKISTEEFAKMIEEFFGINRKNYRDVYGMSEMNGLALECEARYKHLHPWIYPMALDENLEPMDFGEVGRFAFLDPVANSYPGFIITGDRVKLLEACPECGKEGIVIEGEITRMAGAEAKGCGNLMREIMAEEMR